MIIKRATQIGDPVIRTRSTPVPHSMVASKATKKIVRDLVDSMRHHDLVGMAAAQIGINERIFVSEIRETKARSARVLDPVRVFINPKIVRFSAKKVFGYEGCGSVASAGLFGNVKRAESVIIHATDEKGEKFALHASGLLARIIQHEFDHLEGKVFLDRMADMKSLMGREEYLKP